ncbi:MAG TPA: sigma-54 dependent transcriptional regulator, partial [Pseudomonadota bacterium]|nr:sigma-54 dependent transcriptional regulator [Pseudomonadota bacterium]
GEPGVGKEVAASLLHRLSPRCTQPFVAANAACLSPNLIESELFGHEAGSFTGAHSRRRGLFELASGGTLFLDEIGELPLDLQGKLLRVLEGHPFRRVGGEKELSSDARLICATNRNLAQRVQDGLFRADLYYRLRVFEIALPPLRERRADIPELVTYFVTKLGAELGYRDPQVSPAAMKILCEHPWPGNVRELRNVIERALVVSEGSVVLPRHLPLDPAVAAAPAPVPPAAPVAESTASDVSLETLIKRHVTSVYQATGQNVTRAAALLGISRLALRKRLYAYGLRTSDS